MTFNRIMEIREDPCAFYEGLSVVEPYMSISYSLCFVDSSIA
jgi:hypothetical protein